MGKGTMANGIKQSNLVFKEDVTEFKHCYYIAISIKRMWAVKSG